MTEERAIEIIKSWICNAKCISSPCDDSCLYGDDKCAFAMAINALEEKKSKKEGTTNE